MFNSYLANFQRVSDFFQAREMGTKLFTNIATDWDFALDRFIEWDNMGHEYNNQ